jgi:hypothetical protein
MGWYTVAKFSPEPEQSTRSAGTEPTAGNTPEFASSVEQEPVFKALFFSAFCTCV